VATRDRPAQLRACLESLARLDYRRDLLEVIVVDDGGSAPLEPVLAPLRGAQDLKLLRHAWTGPAAARNLGAGLARGELLAFTDDDCTPQRDWLTRLASRSCGQPEDAIGGRTVNALSANPYSSVAQMIIDAGYAQRNYESSSLPFFTTNNLAVPAEGFRSVGGFDPTFVTAEDRDFCARWAAQGRRIAYEPSAIVEHRHALTFQSYCRLYFAYGRGAFRFRREQARHGHPVAIEPEFYLRTLPRQALSGASAPQAIARLGLLGVWHLANTAGFVWQWLRAKS
jgi:GT2 family glycosyltransferase